MMKRKAQKFLSLFLAVLLTFGMVTPVNAAPVQNPFWGLTVETENTDTEEIVETEEEKPADTETEETVEAEEEKPADTETEETVDAEEEKPADTETEETVDAEEVADTETEEEKPAKEEKYSWDAKNFTYNINSFAFDVSGVSAYSVAPEEEVVVDENDHAVMALAAELEGAEVQDDEGNKVALTEEQIQQILYVYQQYLDQWKANANILGVQMPFFLSYNDNGEDGLGILGEMLVLAGYTVDQVRSGDYKFDDLMGMIQNFLYADKFALEFYSSDIASSRKEALDKVEKSGAKTLAQKMLVLNDWIAHKAIFDMPYIMKDDDGNHIMVAENPQKHEHYDEIYNEMYKVYKDQITQKFHDQIYAGIVGDLRQQYYEKAISQAVYQKLLGKDEAEATEEEKAAAKEQRDALMEQYAEEIKNDPVGFVEENVGAEAAAQLKEGCDAFIKDAEENGVEVDPENAPGYKPTVEELTQQTMENEKIVDLDGDGTPETTANDAIPIYAQAAAEGLTNGIIGAWEGNHVGILSDGKGVCAGYSKAFAYLLQYMSPEIYGKNGAGTDMSKSENWKTAEDLYYTDGNLDINKDYLVDMVRITYDAETSMFGESGNFGEVHFWNAVKVDGKWYYVDPCYTDIYVECMSRDRVEIDGTMNHMYFMFSHTTAAEMYDGNMKDIAGLYAEAATDKSYEDSWFARISSNTYINGGKAYYMYDSTDQLAMMREFNEMQGSEDFDASDFEALTEASDPTYSIVYHSLSNADVTDGGADNDFTALIEFNYKENEDDDTSVARVLNASGKMEENELLTELFAQYKEECEIYPSIKMTCALYNGKIYFNLSNCIFSYDLKSCELVKVKEYNTVSGKRDKTNPFGGLAFSLCSEDEAEFTFTNHPIAAMTIKDDGQMYVSIATNLGFISGKDSVSDTKNYGYAFEESNYNPNYNSYMQTSSMGGYDDEKNDNDEFMWSAVIVEKINMSRSCSHSKYEEVTVEAFCGRDGYTEERCTSCGAPKADSRVVEEDSAAAHHFIHFDEQYYTKNDNGKWNTGDCYVCTICNFAIEEPEEPTKNAQESEEDYQKRVEEYEKDKAIYEEAVKTAGHKHTVTVTKWGENYESAVVTVKCNPCYGKQLDCLNGDNNILLGENLKAEVIAKSEIYKDEETGKDKANLVYTAKATINGKDYYSDPVKEPSKGTFPDVTELDFCFDAVEWAVDEKNNITKGYPDGYFKPADGCTRAQGVTFLSRAYKGSAPENAENPFPDVKEGEYYYDAVLWAVDKGITEGYPNGNFGTNDTCTRAQIVTFLYRAAGEPKVTTTKNPFKDVKEGEYYYDAVLWAVANGVTNGISEDTFGVNDECTRGQIVTFLYRALAK